MDTMHLFAGIGGGLLADRILGHNPIIAVEWDRYACQVLRERAAEGWFPNLRVWEGDVRLFDPSEYAGRVDCIHAGFPCQDISVAGKQAGVGEETRSGLYREVLRIAGVVRPRYLFLENVAAIVTNGLSTVLADLAALGYDSEWLCLRASDCGANHRRDRWWCLCTRQPDILSHAEHDRDGRREQLQKGVEVENVAHTISQRGCCGNPKWWDAKNVGKSPRYSWDNQGTMGWWDVESDVGRVVDGCSHRIHRLKGLGNAQVPLQAAVAYRLLGGE